MLEIVEREAIGSIWRMVAPPFVHKEVWEVVCMVAVEAIALGRRRLWAVSPLSPRYPNYRLRLP